MSDKAGVQASGNEEKLNNLRSQLEEVKSKREEISIELKRLSTIALKLQGAIEDLEAIEEEESKPKEEKKSD